MLKNLTMTQHKNECESSLVHKQKRLSIAPLAAR